MRMQKPTLRARDPRSVKAHPKTAEPFYSSADWIKLRDQVRRESRGMCQVPGCTSRGRIVDHIVEIKDGGAKLDRSNTMLCCDHHHSLKTAAERAKRAKTGYK